MKCSHLRRGITEIPPRREDELRVGTHKNERGCRIVGALHKVSVGAHGLIRPEYDDPARKLMHTSIIGTQAFGRIATTRRPSSKVTATMKGMV
jgi:hypothetical protein